MKRSLPAVIGPLLALALFSALPAVNAEPEPSVTPVPDGAARLWIGAAKRDMTPEGDVWKGGFGLGNGDVLPGEAVEPGSKRPIRRSR